MCSSLATYLISVLRTFSFAFPSTSRVHQSPLTRSAASLTPDREGEVGTNRANDLLMQLVEQRFPSLMDHESRRFMVRWARGDAVVQGKPVAGGSGRWRAGGFYFIFCS